MAKKPTHDYYDDKVIFDEELVETGYSDMKIDFNVLSPLDKTMGKTFNIPIKNSYDYEEYKNLQETQGVINSEKPGLATLFKQALLTIGDILGFVFKLIKTGIDQIINSFILPILTPLVPFSTPLIVKTIIDIVMKIVEMVNEAVGIVQDTLGWLLEKVAGKLMKINIPIPEFKIPLFGLELTIPAIDMNGLLKAEPFASLPTDKIINFKKQISELKKELTSVPLTEFQDRETIKSKIDDITSEIKNLLK